MKFFVILSLILVGNISLACPDVSGNFRGTCEEVSSCNGPRPVIYSVAAKQNNCSEIEMGYAGSPTINNTFDIGKNTITEDGLVTTFVLYSAFHLVRIEKVNSMVFTESLRKVQIDGKDYMDVWAATETANCKITMKCQIPSI